ncbi:MAG: (S)-ureidoglycine aminohydrolase [Chloroflexaceae bacterium]|jgi:(S)-ureidoglycine aminohydrolase|nr:(S)-ureidoglycine aminohydrolase [Chloroflexaceae bacterium]
MTDLFGFTRSVVKRNYALLSPAGFVASSLPGWANAQVVAVITPVLGARFCQLLVTLGPDGSGTGGGNGQELFVFVLEGSAHVQIGDSTAALATGGYAFLPPGLAYRIAGAAPGTRLLVFQREYTPLAGVAAPEPIFGNEHEVTGAPFLGDEAAMLKLLLPDTPAFDMAVNIFTFQPGATLPFVETHVMEHGMMMIKGQGIYRLDSDWYPVQNGDVVWMGPYCPQWFVATGKETARYIYYKDVNRSVV